MAMAKDDWKTAETAATTPYVSATLLCDGYRVTLALERLKGTRFCITAYVNGSWSGKLLGEDTEERRRFWRQVTRHVYPPQKRAELRKFRRGFSKKELKRLNLTDWDPDRKYSYWLPYWTSWKALKRHLIKHNQEISLVGENQVEEAGNVQAV